MHHGDWVVGFGERGLELQQTARISRDHYIGLQWADEAGFAVAEFCGGVGLDEIIDSGGTATDGRLGNFEQLRAGDLL